MIVVYFLLAVIIVINLKICSFNDDYCSRKQSTAIKGIFVLIVFFSHFKSYVEWGNNRWDAYFLIITSWIGQLMVVMFLFYSGYGIGRRLEENQEGYINGFLKKRLLPVWLQYSLCVILFLIVNVTSGRSNHYSAGHILLTFTGWESIGNSNWFMFDTFILYLLVFLCFRWKLPRKQNLLLFTIATCVFISILYFTKDSWWWNTLMVFPFGMWYAYSKESIERVLKTKKYYYFIFVPLIISFVFLFWTSVRMDLGFWYIVLSLLFSASVVAITMKIKVGNRILGFFGTHVFSIYMLQRMPMILFQSAIANRYLYFSVCFIITVVGSVAFDWLMTKIKQLIIRC